MKKIIRIFGYPLKRTLSPLFQNAGFRALRLPLEYEACPVEPGKFAGLVEGMLADPAFAGANVTIPHKESALKLRFQGKPLIVSAVAQAIGAANTLYRKGSSWALDNTDAAGFLLAAKAQGPVRGKRILIAGSGGSARAAAYACLAGGASEVLVSSRSAPRAARFCRSLKFKGRHPRPAPSVLAPAKFQAALQKADWVVNTIPGEEFAALLGRWLKKGSRPPQVFDMNYFRSTTGLAMLFEQGARSFELWTGRKAPRQAMWKVLAKEVRKKPANQPAQQIAFSRKSS